MGLLNLLQKYGMFSKKCLAGMAGFCNFAKKKGRLTQLV